MASAAKTLETLQVAGGDLHRTCMEIDDKQLVVFHKSHSMLKPRFSSQTAWKNFLEGSHGGPVIEVDDAEWQWSSASPSAFNCHTLAVGSRVGLGPSDWLEGSASDFTLGHNPTSILLETFFEETLAWDGTGSFDAQQLVDTETLVLEDERTNELLVSGTIRWVEGKPMILSKLGEHPVIICSLQVLLHEYASRFTRLRTFRLRDDAESKCES